MSGKKIKIQTKQACEKYAGAQASGQKAAASSENSSGYTSGQASDETSEEQSDDLTEEEILAAESGELTDDDSQSEIDSLEDDFSQLQAPSFASEDIEQEIAKLKSDLEEQYQKYLYSVAELDNIRKRHAKERSDLLKYSGENIARDILEILDDLERTSEQSAETPSETLLEGIQLITSRMRSLLERHQIKAEDSIGMRFDPAKHEALTMTPSPDADAGTVLHQIKKTYYFKDKLLRPAQVVVVSERTGEIQSADSG